MKNEIHFFDQYGFFGGGQIILLESIKGAIDQGYIVKLHVPLHGPLADEVRTRFDNTVLVYPIKLPVVNHGRKSVFDIVKLLASNFYIFFHSLRMVRGHIVYINGGRLFFLGALLAIAHASIVCLHIHIAPTSSEMVFLKIITKLQRLRLLIVNSHYIEGMVSMALNRSPKIKLVENELSEKFSLLAFRQINFKKGMVVITPGVIRPEKGQDVVVNLARVFPAVNFHIVGRIGEGAEGWTNNLIREAPPNVTFHPATVEIIKLIHDLGCNICLIPSKWMEPFGLVAVEGMACSCITITSKKGGLESIATRTGSFNYNEPDELIEIFENLQSADEDELERIAKSQYSATMFYFGQRTFGLNLMSEINKISRTTL